MSYSLWQAATNTGVNLSVDLRPIQTARVWCPDQSSYSTQQNNVEPRSVPKNPESQDPTTRTSFEPPMLRPSLPASFGREVQHRNSQRLHQQSIQSSPIPSLPSPHRSAPVQCSPANTDEDVCERQMLEGYSKLKEMQDRVKKEMKAKMKVRGAGAAGRSSSQSESFAAKTPMTRIASSHTFWDKRLNKVSVSTLLSPRAFGQTAVTWNGSEKARCDEAQSLQPQLSPSGEPNSKSGSLQTAAPIGPNGNHVGQNQRHPARVAVAGSGSVNDNELIELDMEPLISMSQQLMPLPRSPSMEALTATPFLRIDEIQGLVVLPS